MMNRRQFLRTGATTVGGATVMLLVTQLGCADGDDDGVVAVSEPTTPPPSACDGVSSTSDVVLAHTHTVCIPAADLSSPAAAGATYTTSLANAHTHAIALSQAQLIAIDRGEEIVVSSTTDELHSHAFAVRRA